MSARHFAASLFAITELIERSAAAEFRVDSAVSIEVRADFRHGSFDFGVLAGAALPLAQQVLVTLTVADIERLLQHIGLLRGAIGKTLLALVKRFGARTPTQITVGGDNNFTLVYVAGDNSEIVTGVPPAVATLLQDERVRASLPDVVKPLLSEGIERLRVGSPQEPDFTASSGDVPQFDPPPVASTELTDSVAQTALELLSPDFEEGRVWRVAQGGQPFNVRVLDTDFLHKIDEGEPFSKGDFLIVDLRTRTFATTKGMKAEREVVRVREHRRRPQQGSLFS